MSPTALAVSERYGYSEIATPIFEFTEVFQRTWAKPPTSSPRRCTPSRIAAATVTLRPENTAGVVGR